MKRVITLANGSKTCSSPWTKDQLFPTLGICSPQETMFSSSPVLPFPNHLPSGGRHDSPGCAAGHATTCSCCDSVRDAHRRRRHRRRHDVAGSGSPGGSGCRLDEAWRHGGGQHGELGPASWHFLGKNSGRSSFDVRKSKADQISKKSQQHTCKSVQKDVGCRFFPWRTVKQISQISHR